MTTRKSIISCILSILLAVCVAAQTAPAQKETKTDEQKKAKQVLEKKGLALVEEIVKELPSLRLPDNRILAQATLGDLLWKHDEKRARALFKQAMDGLGELINNSSKPSGAVVSFQAMSFLGDNSGQVVAQLRQQVLQMIAQHDARLARDFLRGTRKDRRGSATQGYDEEAAQEINLASQIAVTDPQQALQIAEEYLDKGLSLGLVGVLSSLKAKDSEAANKLADAMMRKLRSANLAADYATASFALTLLREAIHPGEDDDEDEFDQPRKPDPNAKPLLDERTVRELMNMVVAASLSKPKKISSHREEDADEPEPDEYLRSELEGMIDDVEKYAPSRASALKARIAEMNKDEPSEEKDHSEYEKLMEKGSADAMIEAASKAPADMKDSLYQQAMMKAFADGDADKARQIADEHIIDPDRRDQMMSYFAQQEIWRAASEGKLEKTRELIAPMPPVQRAAVLLQLASTIMGKGDKKTVTLIIGEAHSYISGQPSNFIELMVLLEIARLYGSIDPAKSFDVVESATDQLNQLLAAAAVLDGFEYVRHFKDGEMMSQATSMVGGMVLFCASDIGLLARADFDRAKQTADRFQRTEVRILARLSIAQSALSDKATGNEISTPFLRGFFNQFSVH